MGLEAQCTVRVGKKTSPGKALLETAELIFRGDVRLVIPFKSISAVEARRGQLLVTFPEGAAAFDLGPQAEKWALKIRYPRPVIDKLGVKPESRVSVVGTFPEDFLKQLRIRTADVSTADIVFLAVENKEALKQLKRLQAKIKSNGAIWVVYPKGQKHIRQDDVMAAGKAAKLVDIKVVGLSETHSALKMVIPVALRS